MVRHIETDYPNSVEVGTRADDGRPGPESLYILTTGNRADMRVLTRSQALELVAVLLETVRELEIR